MKKSRIALVISISYLLLVLLSFGIMLATLDSTPMAGIFLVILTQPWPIILGNLQDGSGGNHTLLNGLFLLAGGLLNGLLLYFFISLIESIFKKGR
jgi:hypothetical protein